MEITVGSIGDITGTLVLPFNKGDDSIDERVLEGVNGNLCQQMELLFSSGDITGKQGERLTLHSTEGKVTLYGMGKEGERTTDSCRNAGAKLVAGLKKRHGYNLTIPGFAL